MENIYTSVEPFLKLGNIFGIFPVTLRNPARKGSLKTTSWNILSSFLMLLLLFINIVVAIANETVSYRKYLLLQYGWAVASKIEIFSHLFVLVMKIVKRRKFLLFLVNIHSSDEHVSEKFDFWLSFN